MASIDKNAFIKLAQELVDCYDDSDIVIYSYAKKHNCIKEVYEFMLEENRLVEDVLEFIYNMSGRPNPKLVIVDSENACISA